MLAAGACKGAAAIDNAAPTRSLGRMTTSFLICGPDDATATLLLAHGAGGPMDSRFMNEICALLQERSVRTIRFEFPYMASRRTTGKKKPAPKAETLAAAYVAALTDAEPEVRGAVAIGGKSMGGRVASLVAEELWSAGAIKGLVCLGYPFHPPGLPEKLRTAHLETMTCPALIVQGERDPFGSRAEVEAINLGTATSLAWIDDGDHDFGPRGGSGFTRKGNLAAAADRVASFLAAIRSE